MSVWGVAVAAILALLAIATIRSLVFSVPEFLLMRLKKREPARTTFAFSIGVSGVALLVLVGLVALLFGRG